MKPFSFKNPLFIKTAIAPNQYPVIKNDQGHELPEIAVVGRSNVGKSSLLNDLFLSKDMVKTSSTPGKTQCLNFFTLNKQIMFVDLPGYGYAKVPPAVRAKWGPMIQGYLEKRQALNLVLFLFDIRRLPTDEDRQLMNWIAEADKAVILVLTKVDKVRKGEMAANTHKILKLFSCANLHYLHYSVKDNERVGRHALIKMINDAFQSET